MGKKAVVMAVFAVGLCLSLVGCTKEDDKSGGTIQVINDSGHTIVALYIEPYNANAKTPASSDLLFPDPLLWQKYINVDLDPGDYMIAYIDGSGGNFLTDSNAIARITVTEGELVEIAIGSDYWECFTGRFAVASGTRGFRRF